MVTKCALNLFHVIILSPWILCYYYYSLVALKQLYLTTDQSVRNKNNNIRGSALRTFVVGPQEIGHLLILGKLEL